MLSNSSPSQNSGEWNAWGAVVAMSLAAFALVASEFMPVSLLTPLGVDLKISEGQAGMAISVSGLFALITALMITSIANRVERKRLLLSMIIVMVISGTVVAIAPNYEILMIGRALIGVAIGGFWSLSTATSIQLVSSEQVPRALAFINGGNALATVIAAPIGSYLGAFIGWRWAFFTVVPVAVISLVWLMLSMPNMPSRPKPLKSTNVLMLLKKPLIAWGMLAVLGFFMGQFMLFTYLRPFLEMVTLLQVSMVSFILLLVGLGGLGGTFLIGVFLKDDGLYRTLIIIPLLMAVIAIALIFFGSSLPITAVLLTLWGVIGTAAPVAWFTWVAKAVPNDIEAGGGLFVAICQLAIALGGSIGGVIFDSLGYCATFETSAILLAVTSVLVFITSRKVTKLVIKD